ncbi:hypothetical protein Droror1_Dr00008512 [Drosera rotundifolia]
MVSSLPVVHDVGRLVLALTDGVPIFYEKTVSTIMYGSSGVQVIAGNQVFQGDVALCTVPLGFLKNGSIKFMPELPRRKLDSCEDMLHDLIMTTIHNHPNIAAVKPFVSRLMRDFSSRDSARRVLEKAFLNCLKDVKQALVEYSAPTSDGEPGYLDSTNSESAT